MLERVLEETDLDSVTQAALGAAVGVAVMGRTTAPWKAALVGGMVATLPDLDVFIDKGNAVDDMLLHRAETHAFFWQLLVSPLIAAVIALLTRSFDRYGRWWLLVALALVTHSMLDAMTIYGTRVWLPFSATPVGQGSLFIIDPLYTLPLLIGVLITAFKRSGRTFANTAGLVLSTGYALWSVAAQAYVTEVVENSPQAQGLGGEQIMVTPTPFNTVLWRVVLMRDDHYEEGFYSLLDPLVAADRPLKFTQYDRGRNLEARTREFDYANAIRDFSKGFYVLADDGRYLSISDLRMGQHPYYAFNFLFAEHHSEPVVAITPKRIARRIPFEPGIQWLWQRMLGMDVAPPGTEYREVSNRNDNPSGDT